MIAVTPSFGISAKNAGFLILQLGPDAAVQAGAAWKLASQPANYYSTANPSVQEVTTTNAFVVQFKPIPGWNLPTNQTVVVTPGQIVTNTANYTPANPNLSNVNLSGTQLQMVFSAAAGNQCALDQSTNLINWTPLVTNAVPPTGVLSFTDTPATNNSSSVFYRVRLVQ